MMSKVIRISDSIFSRLQQLSTPLVDTPASVIERVLDHYEQFSIPNTDKPSITLVRKLDTQKNIERKRKIVEAGLYLAPASEANLEATIIRSKPVSFAKSNLPQEQYKVLEDALKGNTEFQCWAMTKNSRSKFMAMKYGDWVLFTAKGTGRFAYSGRVIHKQESLVLGEALWSVVPGLPWDLIYFLDKVTRINIPKESLVSALGYDKGYVVPGIIRVSSARTQAVTDQYGGVSELISTLSV